MNHEDNRYSNKNIKSISEMLYCSKFYKIFIKGKSIMASFRLICPQYFIANVNIMKLLVQGNQLARFPGYKDRCDR